MTDEIKEAYDFAQKEIKKEKEEALKLKVKDIVKRTLEQIAKIDREEKELAEEKKILKKDIDDLRAGRLDLIEERQKNSPLAKDTSVFHVVLKEIQYPPVNSTYTITSNGNGCWGGTTASWTTTGTGWTASTCTSGTYLLSNGIVKYL